MVPSQMSSKGTFVQFEHPADTIWKVEQNRNILAHLFCARCASCELDAQDLRKLGFLLSVRIILSITRNIYATFAQDSTSFSNAQYMTKVVFLSPIRNIWARFAQDCILISPMHNTGCSKKFARVRGTVHCWFAV